MIASSDTPRSGKLVLHPENEMSASAEQKVKDLRATRHLQAKEWNAL
jgi:hypothetical protein